MQTISSASLILAALLAAFSTGCSVNLEPPLTEEEADVIPPPLFVFLSPHADMLLGATDDVDTGSHGVQLDVSVQVNDYENGIALETVQLWVNNETVYEAEVRDALNGRTATFRGIDVAPNAHDHVLLVVDEGGERTLRNHIRVPMRNPAEGACSRAVTVHGDLTVSSPSDLPFAPDTDCLTVEGDLVVSESAFHNLTVLSALARVDGDLIIEANAELESLTGITHLGDIGGDVRIVENPRLPQGEAADFVENVAAGGEVEVSDNL